MDMLDGRIWRSKLNMRDACSGPLNRKVEAACGEKGEREILGSREQDFLTRAYFWHGRDNEYCLQEE